MQCSSQAVFNYRTISIRYSKRCVKGPRFDSVESYFFFFPPLIFPSLSLSPGMGSVPGRGHFFPITFFSSLLFPLFFLSYSNFFLPLFPCLPSLFLSPILFPFLFFILILFLPLFFLFCFLFSSLFLPLSVAFLFSLSAIYYSHDCFLLFPSSLFPMFVLFFFSPFNHFSFSYLFHLFAKGAAIKKDKAEQSKRLVVSTYYKHFYHLLALPPAPPPIIH